MKLVKLFIVLGFVAAIIGCSKANSKVGGYLGFDTDLRLTVYADKNINPDEKGVPSPVFVRMYQLTSADTIEKADFIDLYENDKTLLGDTFLSKQELKRYAPGEARGQNFVLNPDTRYVALFAEFFRYEDSRYVVVFPVSENNVFRNEVYVDITSNQILMGTKKKAGN